MVEKQILGFFTNIDEKDKISVGEYIEYGVGYTDMYNSAKSYQVNDGIGWKILDPGIKNSQGKYEGVKIISTGVPAELYVYASDTNENTWWGNDLQDRSMFKVADRIKK